MGRHRSNKNGTARQLALIFVEGDTEEEFFKKLFVKYLGGMQRKTVNLNGNFNIYNKILDKTLFIIKDRRSIMVRIFCFIDRESTDHNPPLSISILRRRVKDTPELRKRVLSADLILATQMIESWFFHDIEGIYKFLKAPRHERTPNKYRPVKRFSANDLSHLFTRYGKVYIKRKKGHNFVNHLDIDKIFNACGELKQGINLILRKAGIAPV
jgi:hypothetical protein